jgi:hypothetical protein
MKSTRTSLCSNKLKPRCHYDRTYWYKMRQKTVHCLLLSSTSSMGRTGKLSDFKCGLVVGCHISKKSVRNIGTLLSLPRSVVGDVIVKCKHEGTTTMKWWLGRSRLMIDRYSWALRKVVHETCQTSNETVTCALRSAMNCPASTMTVCQQLRERGFHGQAAAHEPNILPVNAKHLLKRCKKQHHWTADNWKCVISGDESHYTM